MCSGGLALLLRQALGFSTALLFCDAALGRFVGSNRGRNLLGILELIIFPDTFSNLSVGIGLDTRTVPGVFPPSTDVPIAVRGGVGALSVPFAVPKFTDVLGAGGRGVGAKTVRPGRYMSIGGTSRQSRRGV